MTDEVTLFDWTHRMTGLEPERLAEARAGLAIWGASHLTKELGERSDIDAAVAAVLLDRWSGELIEQGVPENKLRAKLRGDPDVWPTWAEIVAAGILAEHFSHAVGEDTELLYEPAQSSGSHADYRLVNRRTGQAVDIEFKALGLSTKERRFFDRAAALLPTLCPDSGTLTFHNEFENNLGLTSEQMAAIKRAGERESKPPQNMAGLRAAVIVGAGFHAEFGLGSEQNRAPSP